MTWDAFISYKSEDRPWAKALRDKLVSMNRRAFFDYQALRAGQEWRPQLERALADSGALIVLWSNRSASQNTMSWTEEERYLFSMNEIRSPRERRRPVIFVLLDTAPTALGALHHVSDVKDGGYYPGPGQEMQQAVDNVPQAVWDSIATKVIDAIDEGQGVVRVRTLVLSARREDFNAADLGNQRWQRLVQLLVSQGLATNEADVGQQLDRRYGASAREWRPFATDTVAELLAALGMRLSNDNIRLRFEDADADFAADDSQPLAAAAQALSRQLALVIVDPLALYQDAVARRIASLEPCFRSAMNALAVPALKISDDTRLTDLLKGTAAAGLARDFFRPAIPLVEDIPSVGLHIRNQEELGRILLLAVGRNSAAGPSVTSMHSILAP